MQRLVQQLQDYLQGLPRIAYIIAAPVVVFAVTVAITLATSGGDDGGNDDLALNPTVGPSLDNLDTGATATATRAPASPTPEPTEAPPNRADCAEIQGTEYLSPEERQWYLANCLGNTQETASNSSGGASQPAAGGSAPSSNSGFVPAGEYHIGAQLVIPSIGVNTTVTGMDVGPGGAMPDPAGYFNAVLYNFPYHGGLGGSNKVLAGHVDCAYCHGGGSGTAVFWSVRNLSPGATAQYYNPDGSVTNYVVTNSYTVGANANFSSIVASGAADMTLITCTGNFTAGHYDTRHVVTFQAQ